jgi:hypothetical protein
MKSFTNTSHVVVLFTAFLISVSFTNPVPCTSGVSQANPWTMLHKKDGIQVMYDIQDCLKENLLLCIKLVNETGLTKKIRFRTEILHPDGSKETFNFIKSVAPYSSIKADCSEESRLTGLVRALKNANEIESTVTIHFQNDSVVASE